MASDSGGATSQVIKSDKGLHFMDISPTESKWFTPFMNGLCSRIGERRNQELAISIALMIKIKRLLELECHLEVNQNNKEHIITATDNGLFNILIIVGV